LRPPEKFICVDCGGDAHLISFLPPEDEPDPEPGTAFAYRCSDCAERFDVVMEDPLDDDFV
jgi:DNA-directed RNA polymerase subunit RPC12/RpoP